MKFSSREDIDAPIDRVFAGVTDFAAFERQTLRRGANVRRVDEREPPGVGSAWDVSFRYRNKDRNLRATILRLDRPEDLSVAIRLAGLEGSFDVTLVPLAPGRTRIVASLDLSARSLTARLLLQSLKLAKSNLNNRFSKRLAEFAANMQPRATGRTG